MRRLWLSVSQEAINRTPKGRLLAAKRASIAR